MPSAVSQVSPGLASFLKSLRNQSADTSLDHLIYLLKRRQIAGARPCAVATTHLLLQVVAQAKFQTTADLIQRVREIGRRLTEANPRELAVSNILRRLLGLIREVEEETANGEAEQPSGPPTPGMSLDTFPVPGMTPNLETPGRDLGAPKSMKDVKDDVLNGMREMLDELDQADEQIAGYSLEHIHASQTIMTYSSSITVQKFLLNAAKRRKFTVVHVEGFPNEHRSTYESIVTGRKKNDAEEGETDNRLKTLTSMGINVIVVPDSAIFAVMSRVNTVLLPAHAVMPDGSFTGAAGVKTIAQAAKAHGVPVIALGAVYKLTPLFPHDASRLIDHGDVGKTLGFDEDELMETVDVINPVHDHVPPQLVDIFITNIGAHAPSFIYRVIADHYRQEDLEL